MFWPQHNYIAIPIALLNNRPDHGKCTELISRLDSFTYSACMDQQVPIAPLDGEAEEEHPLLQDELLTQPALPVANEQHNIMNV